MIWLCLCYQIYFEIPHKTTKQMIGKTEEQFDENVYKYIVVIWVFWQTLPKESLAAVLKNDFCVPKKNYLKKNQKSDGFIYFFKRWAEKFALVLSIMWIQSVLCNITDETFSQKFFSKLIGHRAV